MFIRELLTSTSETALEASFCAQLQTIKEKETKGGKPFLEWSLADSTGTFNLKVWNNHPQFSLASDLRAESLIHLSGSWTQNQYGIDGKAWKIRQVTEEEKASFFLGDPELLKKQEADYADISTFLDSLTDPRLQLLSREFIGQFHDRFRRTAAAKKNHHARRGGLVEHVAQMMRTAHAISQVYPYLHRDLLIAAILFHDCGKLWENSYPESGFNQLANLHGEMLGHIPLGMELVNKLWRDLDFTPWKDAQPSNEDVRLHLLHLIASHHGQYDFGSPTLPRTPEAHALHYIDNLDAKLEMVTEAYQTATQSTPGIYDRQFPLPANLVAPLGRFQGDQKS